MLKLVPKYTPWEAINVAIMGVHRALEEIRALARLPGPAGKDGKDGRDGFSIEDLSFETKDDGDYIIYARGDVKKEHRLSSPFDMGVWHEGKYLRGHCVSFGGSTFIAQEDTTDKPETSKAWRLAVKRGRDGKDGGTSPSTPRGPVKVR